MPRQTSISLRNRPTGLERRFPNRRVDAGESSAPNRSSALRGHCLNAPRLIAIQAILIAASIHILLVLHAAETPATPDAVSFSKDIAPLLQAKCVTCHNAEKAKGGYRLHTFAELLKPGESKDAPVVPGDPAKSKLHQLLVSTDPDDRMPQKDDPLPPAQVQLIARWITQGARFDGSDPKALLSALSAPARHPDAPVRYARPVPILALAYHPDGAELAASGYHEVTIWNSTNGTLRRRIANAPQQIQSLAYTPDGKLLALCGGNPGRSGEIKLVHPHTGATLRTLATANDLFLTLAFSPDGQRLLAGGADNTIRLFEVATGKELYRLEQHADWVMSLAFAPDGKHFASASRDKTARYFEAKSGELEETYDGHGAPVFAVAFSADGKSVLSAGRDREIHAWSTKDARKLFEARGFEGDILRLIAQGEHLFSASADRHVRQHRLLEKKAELVRTYTGHRDTIYALAYHDGTKRLASGSYDGEVRVWDTGTSNTLLHFIAAPQ